MEEKSLNIEDDNNHSANLFQVLQEKEELENEEEQVGSEFPETKFSKTVAVKQ